jgi:type IV pilus assembly protein PilE
MKHPSQRGFTLIEVMIAIAVIAILAAAAMPAYTSYVLRGNRGAAQEFLLDVAQREQQYFADARAYGDTLTALSMTIPAAVDKYYDIAIEVDDGPPPGFTVTATPKAGTAQEHDVTLSIDSKGAKLPADKW